MNCPNLAFAGQAELGSAPLGEGGPSLRGQARALSPKYVAIIGKVRA